MLIGNPVDFDRIRARYEALKYPTPEQAAFNATRASYEGLLTGSGFDTEMIPTTTPGQQVSFAVDPNTGQVTTQIPQYDIPNFQNIYDEGLGLISDDGLPKPVSNQPTTSGQTLASRRQSDRGGNFRDRNFMTDNRNINQIQSDLQNAKLRNVLLGLINPAFGLLGTVKTLADQKKVDDYRQSLSDKEQSIKDNQRISNLQSSFKEDTIAPGADASTLGGTGGRRGGAGPDGGRFGGDRNVGDASNIGGTGGRRGGAGGY